VPRLLLLAPAELTRDQRARRASAAARALGYDVVGLCGRISGEQPVPLDGVHVVRVGREGTPSHAWTPGAARREQPLVREVRGLYRVLRLAVRTLGLARAGRTLGRFDAVHANDLETLPAGYLLSRRPRARLVYDAHELYADFEPDPPRLARLVLAVVERTLARRADSVVTVSPPIAEELARRFGVSPIVVANAPPLDAREPPEPSPAPPLRVVYQGALGPGRSLDDLVAALEAAPSVRLTLRVQRSAPGAVERALPEPLRGRIDVLEPVPPTAVLHGLHGHHVGVLFDRPLTRNAELSSPNKLFEYLMAGLAVVAPAVEGLAFVEDEHVGLTYPPDEPRALGAALERLASERELLATLRRNARRLAVDRLNAEAQWDALRRAWASSR
jgi:glycogen(starch) synthase